jgi:hypothetical protein
MRGQAVLRKNNPKGRPALDSRPLGGIRKEESSEDWKREFYSRK